VLELAKKVEGGIGIKKRIFFNVYFQCPILRGGGNIGRAVIVPGTTIGSGGDPPPPVI